MEPGRTRYQVYITTESGAVLDVSLAASGVSWGEAERELSTRITFSLYNARIDDGRLLSSVLAIGQAVTIRTDWSDKDAALGFIKDIERDDANPRDTLDIVAYDVLYHMQKSQDNIYFTAGRTTESAIRSIFDDWGVSIESYNGPNVAHSEILYRNKYISDIVLGILDEAAKKGGGKAVIRADGTKVSVVRKGSNREVYCLTAYSVVSARYKISISDMVTRVKIVASGKDEGAPAVEAVVDGHTDYGVLQRILTHASSDSIEDAKKAAQEILDENGEPSQTITVQAPDVPPIRKGDLVNIQAGPADGDYIVKSIQHNAESGLMTLDVEPWEGFEEPESPSQPGQGGYKVGDVVQFRGGRQYVSSYSDATGYAASAGPATITIAGGSGMAHPWHLATTDWQGSAPVYGWVDDGTFEFE